MEKPPYGDFSIIDYEKKLFKSFADIGIFTKSNQLKSYKAVKTLTADVGLAVLIPDKK